MNGFRQIFRMISTHQVPLSLTKCFISTLTIPSLKYLPIWDYLLYVESYWYKISIVQHYQYYTLALYSVLAVAQLRKLKYQQIIYQYNPQTQHQHPKYHIAQLFVVNFQYFYILSTRAHQSTCLYYNEAKIYGFQ